MWTGYSPQRSGRSRSWWPQSPRPSGWGRKARQRKRVGKSSEPSSGVRGRSRQPSCGQTGAGALERDDQRCSVVELSELARWQAPPGPVAIAASGVTAVAAAIALKGPAHRRASDNATPAQALAAHSQRGAQEPAGLPHLSWPHPGAIRAPTTIRRGQRPALAPQRRSDSLLVRERRPPPPPARPRSERAGRAA